MKKVIFGIAAIQASSVDFKTVKNLEDYYSRKRPMVGSSHDNVPDCWELKSTDFVSGKTEIE